MRAATSSFMKEEVERLRPLDFTPLGQSVHGCNDDWRVETDGGGAWQGNRRLKLIPRAHGLRAALASWPGARAVDARAAGGDLLSGEGRQRLWLLLEVE